MKETLILKVTSEHVVSWCPAWRKHHHLRYRNTRAPAYCPSCSRRMETPSRWLRTGLIETCSPAAHKRISSRRRGKTGVNRKTRHHIRVFYRKAALRSSGRVNFALTVLANFLRVHLQQLHSLLSREEVINPAEWNMIGFTVRVSSFNRHGCGSSVKCTSKVSN